MERRWSHRVPLREKVTVYCQGSQVLTAPCRNIGLEGMLIDTTPEALPLYRAVEVEFNLTLQGRAQRLRIPAYVTHTDDGVGLMFTGDDPAPHRIIDEFIRAGAAATV